VNANDPNVAKVELIAAALGGLCERLILVGGCATGLLVTDAAAAPARVTFDVDLLAEVTARSDYYRLEKEIAALGFTRDMAKDAPICRWRYGALEVDLMPSDPSVLGFSNRWYPVAIQTAQVTRLPSGGQIRLIAAPALMATKFVAFADRGNGNFLASHDLEDIVTVVAGRPELAQEIAESPAELQAYLAQECASLIANAAFHDGLQGLVSPDEFHGAQVATVVERLTRIAGQLASA